MSRNPSGGEHRKFQAELMMYGKALNQKKKAGIFAKLRRIQHGWIVGNETEKEAGSRSCWTSWAMLRIWGFFSLGQWSVLKRFYSL